MNGANDPDGEPLLRFPCSFPIKVMGRHEPGFETLVVGLISERVGAVAPENVRSRASSNGRYLSVTVTIEAQSREQLDDVYRSLTASGQVLIVL